MNAVQISRDVILEPADNNRLANLCGQFDEHLRQIERRLDVEIASRGNHFRVTGQPGATQLGSDLLHRLFRMTDRERLDPERVHILLQESVMKEGESVPELSPEPGDDEEHLTFGVSANTPIGLQLQAAGDFSDEGNQVLFSTIYRFGSARK